MAVIRLMTAPVVILLLILGCDEGIAVDCHNAFDEPPQQLLDGNEYVLTGKLVAVDSIAYFGRTTDYDTEYDNYLIQYTFRPVEIFKASSSATDFKIWRLTTVSLASGYRTGIEATPESLELVYGNDLGSSADILNVMQPLLWTNTSEFADILSGKLPIESTEVHASDVTIGQRIRSMDSLDNALHTSADGGVVLYGTDFGWQTSKAFRYGLLMCCDSATFTARKLSAEEYLEELRELVE